MTPSVLVIDNYDSFTFNLVQLIGALGCAVTVRRNDEVSPSAALDHSHVVVSPGPGAPSDAGMSKKTIETAAGRVPILGVCLGHQAIVEVFGGRVARAASLVHGKASTIEHDGTGVFAGMSGPIEVGRYHSLAAVREELPDCLRVTASVIGVRSTPSSARDNNGDGPGTTDSRSVPRAQRRLGEIMGVRHESLAIEGVQFHPESVLTPMGVRMLANFLGVDSARAAGVRVFADA